MSAAADRRRARKEGSAALGRALLGERILRLWSFEKAVRDGGEPRAVHQMRVETRRLRTLLRVFRAVLGEALVDETRNLLGVLGRTLGAVRDVDILEKLSAELAERTHGAIRKRSAAARRPEAQAALEKLLDSAEVARLRRLLARLAGSALPAARARSSKKEGEASHVARELPVPSRRALREFARDAVSKQLRRVRRRHEVATLGEVEAIHALRRALKSLRYSVEALSPLLPRRARDLGPRAAELQDALGAVHDLDEWLAHAAPSPRARAILSEDREEKLALAEARIRKLLRPKRDPKK